MKKYEAPKAEVLDLKDQILANGAMDSILSPIDKMEGATEE